MDTKKTKKVAIKRRTQEERSNDAKAKLIKAAIELIYKKGYSNVTTQQIANHAGMTRGAIQHHFDGRETLFVSIMKYVEEEWVKSFQAVLPNKNISVEDRVDKLLDNLWHFIHKPVYLVVIDIRLSTRADTKLLNAVKNVLQSSAKLYVDSWLETFSPEVSISKINESRELATTVLQGITVTGILGMQRGKIPAASKNTLIKTKGLIHEIMASGIN